MPTSRSTPKCFETAGCGSPSASTMAPTARPRRLDSRSMICRRRGSAMAVKTSVVAEVRDMAGIIFLIMEYVKRDVAEARCRDNGPAGDRSVR